MYMNAAARGGGASIRPSLSTAWLGRSLVLWKQDVLMLTFMVHLVALSLHSQRSTSSQDVDAVSSSSIIDCLLLARTSFSPLSLDSSAGEKVYVLRGMVPVTYLCVVLFGKELERASSLPRLGTVAPDRRLSLVSLSSLLLSLSLSPCRSHPVFIFFCLAILLAFCLLFSAMKQLLSDIEKLGCGCHTRAPKPISVSCVCRGAEARMTLCNICKIIFKSSVPAACRRLLRGADCSTCTDDRSGPRVADPASISTMSEPISEGLAQTKTRWSSDWTCKPTFQSKDVRAGPLTGYITMHSLPDGLISGLLRKRATANPFNRASCYSWSSNEHTNTTVWQKNQERTTLPSTMHQRSTKSTSQTQKCM